MIKAYLLDEPHIMRTRILLRQRTAGGPWYWDGTSWQTMQEGTIPPDPDGIVIPQGALEAVVEALHPIAAKSAAAESEADVLRWVLSKEQGRVDEILEKLLKR